MLPTRSELHLATASLGRRPELELLYEVIMGPLEQAERAFGEWRIRYPIDRIDIHAMKLLPLVYQRLLEMRVDDLLVKKIRGIVKYLWLTTEVIDSGATEAAQLLADRDIRAIGMKGVALRALGVGTPGLRPMVDADLIVTEQELAPSVKRLMERGWQRKMSFLHQAVTLVKGKAELDLHMTTLSQDPRFNAKEWGLAVVNRPYLVLDHTASFIVTLLHGMKHDGGLLWVFDAEALIASGKVKWIVVEYFAESRGLVLTMTSALGRVRGVPELTLTKLRGAQASHIEALELRHLMTKDRVGARARDLMYRLRRDYEIVRPETVRAHEHEPGLRWDRRWSKEWA